MELQLNLKVDDSIRIEKRYRTGTSKVLIEQIKKARAQRKYLESVTEICQSFLMLD